MSDVKQVPSRRTFLAVAGVSAAIPLPAAGYTFFSSAEVAVMEAVCEQFLPSDDLPGSKEAGVVTYIDRQLTGTLRRFAPVYREALAALAKAGFVGLAPQERARLLEGAEAGRVTALPSASVRMMVDHTMQGFLGDPKYGGNKRGAGWKALGFTNGGHSH